MKSYFSACQENLILTASLKRNLPSVRSWQLIQVGNARVPMVNAETTFGPAKYRDLVIPLHNGGQHNFFLGERAPLDSIPVTHSGSYAGCSCGHSIIPPEGITDYELLKRYGGLQQVPMLFVSDLIHCEPYQWLPVFDCGCCDEHSTFNGCFDSDPQIEDCDNCPDDDCLERCWASKRHPCPTYAWAFGRITQMPDTKMGTKTYAGELQEISFELSLESALRRISYPRWRRGGVPSQDINAAPSTGPEIEALSPEDKMEWEVNLPCKIPSCCDGEKFWVRDLNRAHRMTLTGRFDINYWEYTRAFVFSGNTSKRVYVGGNAEPEVLITATADAVITVRNEATPLTTIDYANAPAGSFIFSNSLTGEAWSRTSTTVLPIPGVCKRLRLEPGVNALTFASGSGVIAFTERYL